MKVIINFTEDMPDKMKITDIIANSLLKGVIIQAIENILLFRFYGINIIKEDEQKIYYRPFSNPDINVKYNNWYELKRMPKTFYEIGFHYLVTNTIVNSLINKLLNQYKDEYFRKTD